MVQRARVGHRDDVRLDLIAPDGILATADAERHGLDRQALARLVRSGALVRLTRGWYALGGGAPLDAHQRHRFTALALGRQYRYRAVVSHHSALVLRGLPTYASDLRTVHLTSAVDDQPARAAGATRRSVTVRRPGAVVHRAVPGLVLPPGPGEGLRASMPVAHAVVQAGLLAGPEAALVPADAALHAGLTDAKAIARALSDLAGHRGIGPVRAALAFADARHESPGESRTAYVLRALGFKVEPQVEVVAEGRRYRADFRVSGTRVLVEFDGAVKYSDSRSLFEEKRREDALRRAGWVVVRLVWADLARPELVRSRMVTALRQAA